jgi:hypothetical protein
LGFAEAIFLGLLDVKSWHIIEVDSITLGNFEKEISRFEKDTAYVWTFFSEIQQIFECLVETKPRENLSLFLNNPPISF